MPEVDPIIIPVPAEVETVDEKDYQLLKMHVHNGAQRQADGAGHYAENLRYAYLEGKDKLNQAQSVGWRYLQGPHPQHGSPDSN